MTRAIHFTKAKLRRAIEAAREAGLDIKGIAPEDERDSVAGHARFLLAGFLLAGFADFAAGPS